MDDFLKIIELISTLPKEFVPSSNALGRVLAEPVRESVSSGTNVATIDGFAVRSEDVDRIPTTLFIQGESKSTHPFRGTLHKGNAIWTAAGGQGCKWCRFLGGSCQKVVEQEDLITLNAHPVYGENICPAGMDFSPETDLFQPGTVMNSWLVGLASTMHLLWLPVVRRPRVAILAVGNELAMPGRQPIRIILRRLLFIRSGERGGFGWGACHFGDC